MQESDRELIAQSRDQPEAFTEVFDRHYAAISDYLRRRLEPSIADELASEVFLVAFRRRRDFNAAWNSARPWLFGIATNLVRANARAEQRRLRAYARLAFETEPDPSDDAIDRADAHRAHSALVTALAGLRREERDALLLAAWGDLSYSEIAEALDVPIGTVRSRLARCREQIQEQNADLEQYLEKDELGVGRRGKR